MNIKITTNNNPIINLQNNQISLFYLNIKFLIDNNSLGFVILYSILIIDFYFTSIVNITDSIAIMMLHNWL